MHGGGTVALRTRVTGNQVVIEVTDEGPGVPAELGARIFERTISGRNSTGIGLAVARDLAEADGGTGTAPAAPGGLRALPQPDPDGPGDP